MHNTSCRKMFNSLLESKSFWEVRDFASVNILVLWIDVSIFKTKKKKIIYNIVHIIPIIIFIVVSL